MKNKKLIINDVLEKKGKIDLQLCLIAGNAGLNREIKVGDVNRPGLSLAGFFDYFGYERIQVFGLGETAYMSQLSDDKKTVTIKYNYLELFDNPDKFSYTITY